MLERLVFCRACIHGSVTFSAVYRQYNMAPQVDDFASVIVPADGAKGKGKGVKRMRYGNEEEGQMRPWLKIYETGPPQFLNAYGQAQFCKLKEEEIWQALIQPQKSGAMYVTEYASESAERRGIAANRWIQSVLNYCKYQQEDKQKDFNKKILKDDLFKQFYEEIDRLVPSLTYCLAPRKIAEKTGASALRQGVSSASEQQVVHLGMGLGWVRGSVGWRGWPGGVYVALAWWCEGLVSVVWAHAGGRHVEDHGGARQACAGALRMGGEYAAEQSAPDHVLAISGGSFVCGERASSDDAGVRGLRGDKARGRATECCWCWYGNPGDVSEVH